MFTRIIGGVVWFLWASLGSGQTPILSFSAGDDKYGSLRMAEGDLRNGGGPAIGGSSIPYHALFGVNSRRDPDVGDWNTPAFFGGYLLHSMNDSGAGYFPNFVRHVGSPATGRGYVSLPITKLFYSDTTGTVTNSVFGTFVTPTTIPNEGVFRVFLKENTIDHPNSNGAAAMFRGAAFDGSKWLVTAESAVVPTSGVDHARVSTRGGWLELDTTDFSYGETTVSLAGPLKMSGVWFMASETASQTEAGFAFAFSDAFFTPRGEYSAHSADLDQDRSISLSELLRVIELYNTRFGSTRTGRYMLSDSEPDGVTPDAVQGEGKMALYASYHAADSDQSGTLSLSELLRVIELYNVRSGSIRTGKYSLSANSDDGFAPGESVEP